MPFNEAQLEAIRHQNGAMMVLAGPGSGKTTVLTHRVRYLVEKCGVSPSEILVITFTKAAAGEMRERFEKLTENRISGVGFGTFHAVFFRILKLAYGYDAGSIVREEKQVQFIREMVDRCRLDLEDEGDFIRGVLGEISAVKGELMDLQHYYAKSCSDEIFRDLFRGYEDRMRRANLIDFDDMMVMCWQLFRERPDILAAWQRKYRYILIDEFQDINRLQYQIVRLMAAPENNLFIVGDDDQSIYRFRGARPEIMLGFERDYPGAKRVLLDVNYRSTSTITEAAGKMIGVNRKRFAKQIQAPRGPGKAVFRIAYEDPRREAEAMAAQIRAYREAGVDWAQMAVLYRTNTGPRMLVEKLMEYNIPFCARDALPNLYDHWISRNILSYLQAAKEPVRSLILPIINRPQRYVSRDVLEGPVISWEAVKNFYQDKDWMVDRIERLEYDLSMIRQMAPAAAVNYVRKAVGYDQYLKEYAKDRKIKEEELLETADQLQESAAGYKTLAAWTAHMEEYKETLKQQSQNSRSRDGVAVMTMHSAKGLEYRVVFIPDANEGVTPHHKALLDDDMEEERRLFYVAMTRAKDRLHLYWVKERYGKKQEVSRFVKESMT